MAETTKIEWAHRTWSPWRGCAKVSPGCTNCYAEKLSHRNPAVLGEWGLNAKRVVNADWRKPLAWDRKAAKLGERHRVFPSLCDPFEDREDLDETRARFLELIEATPNLDWLLLTKRPESWRPCLQRLADVGISDGDCLAERWLNGTPPENVWLGVSVENQQYADKRLSVLREILAALKWVSYEPALGPVDFTPHLGFLDWIVCGGESGSEPRWFDLQWARSADDQCRESGVPFFMKQLGGFCGTERYGDTLDVFETKHPKGGDISEFPADLRVREFPKPRAEGGRSVRWDRARGR